jgi:uncharacterized membrane-anchored protein
MPRLPLRRGQEPTSGIVGAVKLGTKTKGLTKRLEPGDIAVINHVDLDRVAAEGLVSTGVAAVVNAATSISGRYPNLGPELIVNAGIALVDAAGEEIFTDLKDGEEIRIDGGSLCRGSEVVATGERLDAAAVTELMRQAEEGMAEQLKAFAANTIEYAARERDILLGSVKVPAVETHFDGKHALVVVRGYHFKEDIDVLRPYLREYKPVLIGVDGGADALLEKGYKPDMIVGDMDSVSETALRSGAEIVVHAYRDGRAPGAERVRKLGVEPVIFPLAGTSEDIAMIIADENGAELIVAVGTHTNLVEFLDKGRSGMASTFLTRLRIGSKLVDAKGVSQLYRSRISATALILLVIAALVAVAGALAVSQVGQIYWNLLTDAIHDFFDWIGGLFE